jgi:hypothetical protein
LRKLFAAILDLCEQRVARGNLGVEIRHNWCKLLVDIGQV